jgi:hypothetical protein
MRVSLPGSRCPRSALGSGRVSLAGRPTKTAELSTEIARFFGAKGPRGVRHFRRQVAQPNTDDRRHVNADGKPSESRTGELT